MTENIFECGKCGYFDGMCCQKTGEERYEDEIVDDCIDFDLSIYYGG